MERIALVALSGKDRFRIGAGHFADRNPADATNQSAEQKRDGCEWNEGKEAQNKRKGTIQNFADPNQPTGAMVVNRAIGGAVFIDAQPDEQCRLNSGRVKSDDVERRNSVSEQF